MPGPIHTPESLDPAIHTLDDLVEAIRTSQLTVILFTGSIDSKIGIEAGIAVLADRPLLVVNLTSRPLPRKLFLVADMVAEAPQAKDDAAKFQAVMTAAISSFMALLEARERAQDTAPQS